MRGTQPSAFSHLLHDRGVRFGALLAVAVAIPVAVLFYFQFRSLNDLEETSVVVLRQLSRDTAESLGREIEQRLKRPHIDLLLRPGQQNRLEPPDFVWLDGVFAEGLAASPFIQEVWVWSETLSASRPEMFVFARDQPAAAASTPTARFRLSSDRFADVVPQARQLGAQRRAIVAYPAHIDGRAKYVQLQLGFDTPMRERVVRVLGFMVDAEELHTRFFPALMRSHLAEVRQPTGFPALQVSLADASGRAVAPTGDIVSAAGAGGAAFVDERTFPLVFFDRDLLEYAAPYEQQRETWRVRTSYGALTIPEIVSASTRPQTLLTIMLALGMAGGVFFVANAAAREVRVAELKSNFVAAVSHDLKTPLALIQLFAETLELGRVRTSERAQEYYRIINGEARKLTRLIENILDFSRMEAGLRPYRAAPSDVGDLTRKVIAAMGSQFEQAQFDVQLKVAPALPHVAVDEDATERAVENLLTNAMKYSGESRAIEVAVRRSSEHVCVAVTDHGIGISRRDQRRIFRKFYRVNSALGGGPQGTGLGLAIVDHTMRGHGGFVRVDSEPQHGSTFTLHFPIPADLPAEGDRHEAHSGDRRRAADAARPA